MSSLVVVTVNNLFHSCSVITYKFPYIVIDLHFIFQWVIAYFVLNFVAMATGWGSIMAEFVRRISIARHQKPPNRRKHLSDISYTSWVIAYFVTNVVHHTAHFFLFRPTCELLRKTSPDRRWEWCNRPILAKYQKTIWRTIPHNDPEWWLSKWWTLGMAALRNGELEPYETRLIKRTSDAR